MIKTITIKNGPTLYLYKDNKRHSVFFEIVTKFGGITKDFISNNKEYHIQDGVAHILEHYVVENNNIGNFLDILGNRQMYTNASTDNYTTRYFFEAVEDYKYGIKTILDGIYSVKFKKEKLEKLKNPIYQEIRSKMNNKFYHANILEVGNLFHSSTFRSVGGTLDEVKNTTINDIKVCYETFYQPSNQVIFIGGNFDTDEVIDLITDFYNKLSFKRVDFSLIEGNEKDSVVKERDVLEFPTEQDFHNISYKINMSKYSNRKRLDYDFYLLFFFQMFFGVTSRLYKELVKDKIITGGISTSSTLFDKFLVISIGTYTDDGDIFINKVMETIKKLDDFNEEVFELYKKNIIVSLILREENIIHTLFPFIDNVLYYDYPYIDKISDIENMTYSEFIKDIKDLDFNNYSITSIINK